MVCGLLHSLGERILGLMFDRLQFRKSNISLLVLASRITFAAGLKKDRTG